MCKEKDSELCPKKMRLLGGTNYNGVNCTTLVNLPSAGPPGACFARVLFHNKMCSGVQLGL